MTEKVLQCGGCSLKYYCSEECHRKDWDVHGKNGECAMMKAFSESTSFEGEDAVPRMIIRAASVRRHDTDENARGKVVKENALATSPYCGNCRKSSFADVISLLSHERRQQADAYLQVQRIAESLSSNIFADDAVMTTQVITQLIFAAQSNAHAFRDPAGQTVAGIGLYPAASMVNHSCVPNAHHYFAEPVPGRPPRIVFRAIRPIATGEDVTYSYTKTYEPSETRRANLRTGYFFDCDCRRCIVELLKAEKVCMPACPDTATPTPAPEVPERETAGSVDDANTQSKNKRKKKKKKKGAGVGGEEKSAQMDELEEALREAGIANLGAALSSSHEPSLPVPDRYLVIGASNPSAPRVSSAEVCRVSQRLDAEVERIVGQLHSASAFATEGEEALARLEALRRDLTAALLRAASSLHPRHCSMFKAYTAAAQPCTILLESGEANKADRIELLRERVRFCAYSVACLEGSIGENHPEMATQYRLLANALADLGTTAGDENGAPDEARSSIVDGDWEELDEELGGAWLVLNSSSAAAEKARDAMQCCVRMMEICFGATHQLTMQEKDAMKRLRNRLPSNHQGRKRKEGRRSGDDLDR